MFAIVICLVLFMCTLTISLNSFGYWTLNKYYYYYYLKLCVVCINGRRYVCCSECYVVSDECDEPTSCLVCNLSLRTVVKLCTLGVLTLGVSFVS